MTTAEDLRKEFEKETGTHPDADAFEYTLNYNKWLESLMLSKREETENLRAVLSVQAAENARLVERNAELSSSKQSRSNGHFPDCRWEKTTPEECAYRKTHFYCPHKEHACDCKGHFPAPPERKEQP